MEGYKLIGNDAYASILDEAGAMATLVMTAGMRLNRILERQELPYRFTIRPDLRPRDLQVKYHHL